MTLFADMDASAPRTAPTSPWFAYRMRWKRRRLLARALRRRKELRRHSVTPDRIRAASILAFSTMRNEMARLPHFLDHYRALGVDHFLIVDNESDDGTTAFLQEQRDVSLWQSGASYKQSRFGVDWLTCLQFRFGHGRWCLTVDADELLVLPGGRDLRALTAYLDENGLDAFGAIMLDLYPKSSVSEGRVRPGDDPLDHLKWFDATGYRGRRHRVFDNLWIQGGPRDRVFFRSEPDRAPTLNKTPLVRWNRRFAYVTSTHQALPMRLNRVFEPGRPTGALLHTKFLPDIAAKSAEELERRQHFENSNLYAPYHRYLIAGVDLWHPGATRYEGPVQLERLGLIGRGNWR
jgi:glycosyltransferase involved in cell wall biosynthesis